MPARTHPVPDRANSNIIKSTQSIVTVIGGEDPIGTCWIMLLPLYKSTQLQPAPSLFPARIGVCTTQGGSFRRPARANLLLDAVTGVNQPNSTSITGAVPRGVRNHTGLGFEEITGSVANRLREELRKSRKQSNAE